MCGESDGLQALWHLLPSHEGCCMCAQSHTRGHHPTRHQGCHSTSWPAQKRCEFSQCRALYQVISISPRGRSSSTFSRMSTGFGIVEGKSTMLNSIGHQIPPTTATQPSLHSSHHSASSCEGYSQWSEGDTHRSQKKVLDCQGSQSCEVSNSPVCLFQTLRRGTISNSATTSSTRYSCAGKNHRFDTLASTSWVHSTYIHLIAPARRKCGFVFLLTLSQGQCTSPTCPPRSSSYA